ncbi:MULTISPECIES: TatD family hydrolase [Anaeromyxobacter]|uniref:TatD family hydrolase n=1 Tax=Anaeromyxobacter TaxID=161492 RepID=UPI001F579B03|nr:MULTISPECIES: TatD family hydrolase [unclassified Anaeromyxobacter]
MIDTHCHLDKLEFAPDRDRVLERARAAGVSEVVVPAIGPDGWAGLAGWARANPGVHFGLGLHPQLLPELDPRDDARHLAALEAALAEGGAVAVGECGLDGPSVAAGAPLERQVRVLRAHLALARRHRLPVVLHCLKLHEPLIALLEEAPLPAGGVLHSFSGSADQVKGYLRFGLHFSFAGPVTYERARRPIAAVQAVPPDRLLLETDAPDQTPRPHRGRNEPAFLPEIASAVARATGRSVEEVDALTTANARALFRLGPQGR